jgi:hypothetical protein
MEVEQIMEALLNILAIIGAVGLMVCVVLFNAFRKMKKEWL